VDLIVNYSYTKLQIWNFVVIGGDLLTLHLSQLQIGTTLANRYHIISRLGEGGMGAVFLADDLKLDGKQWAIKESLMHSYHVEGFADEAGILVKLDHPFLPKIIDFFPPDPKGYSYLVMDYIKGQTLQKLFESRKTFTVETVVQYAKQLCQVFDYLHHFKPMAIIYRDLKPSNVMVDGQNNIRLIDFGIARNYSKERDSDTVQLGTVGFAAPEQYDHQQTDARTDLYTLGALMFYLLNNGYHYAHQPAQIKEITERIPVKLAAIIIQLLSIHPKDRFQTASEVLTELENVFVDTLYVPESHSPSANHYPQLTRKLIIIGSLYGGAGSTFVAMALARSLNHYAIPHALVESMGNAPELYTLLFGERHAPQGYKYSAEKIIHESMERTPIWKDAYSEWHPLPPFGFGHTGHKEYTFKLLYSILQPIVILDVSHHWSDQAVMELCRQADEIVIVTGPSLTKLNTPHTLKHVDLLLNYQKEGKSIQCVANRVAPFSAQREWLSALPFAPVCSIPEFNYCDVIQSQWSGKLFQDQAEPLKLLNEQVKPFLQKVIPASYLSMDKAVNKSSNSKWFKFFSK
jgi:serine/threonine-protein kinase